MPDIFVSYSRRDREPVRKLVDLLVESGWDVWWDQQIRPGQSFDNAIESVISESSCVLVVWSPNSVQSEWVKNEAADGLNRDCLIPVMLEPVELPLAFRRKQAVDISSWRGGRSRNIDLMLETIEAVLRDEHVPLDTQHQTVVRERQPLRRNLKWPIVLGLLAAVGIGGFFAERELNHSSPAANQQAVEAPSLAILPFENRSPDPDDSYFSAGLHEEIIARMSRISSLSVIARTSMMNYEASDKAAQQIGEELGAELVMFGSVRFADNKVKIIVELVDTATSAQRWSEVYNVQLDDIFEVQGNVAEKIAQTIGLSTTESAPAMQAPTRNSAAYIAYMKGRYTGIRWQPDIAEKYLREAIDLDPDYAHAYAELAQLYYFKVDYYSLPADIGIPIYVDLMRKAYELDSEDPNVMAKTTLALLQDGRPQEAEQIKQRLLNKDVANPDAYLTLALYPAGTDEQLDLLRRAIELDPLNAFTHYMLAWYALRGRLFDEALAAIDKAEELELNPSIFYVKGEILRHLGRVDEASTYYEQAIGIMEQRRSASADPAPSILANLSYLYAMQGESAKAEVLIEELEALTSHQHIGPTQMVIAYAGVQDIEKTVIWLENWFRDYGPWFPVNFVQEHPRFDFLRESEAYRGLMQKINAATST